MLDEFVSLPLIMEVNVIHAILGSVDRVVVAVEPDIDIAGSRERELSLAYGGTTGQARVAERERDRAVVRLDLELRLGLLIDSH